ncbi:MAG: uracil-DNA glycosylase [bacterium]|nr:uracil-DNA glycosylase [bacterium]
MPRTEQSGEAHIPATLLTPTSAPDPKPARGIAPAAPLPSPTTTQATVPASSEEFFLASECVLAEEVPRFVPPPGDRASQLRALRAFIGDCQRCPILARSRTQIVFGVGNPHAEIMFVGEAPGADEDAQGIPFVGRAGQLLTNIIEKGMGLRRADVYIANILKCRPPNNREPLPDEVANCTPFLHEQLAIVKPRVIVALGAYAARYLTGSSTPISKLRGTFHHYRDIPVMPTFHPAYLLRNYSPENRRMVWEDMKKVLAYVRG